jgi:hypothetical protein
MPRHFGLLLAFALLSCKAPNADDSSDEVADTSTTQSSESEGSGEVCLYECTVNLEAGTSSCDGAVSVAAATSAMAGTIDMSGYHELSLSFEVCEPTQWVLHLADSDSSDGYGGDAGTSSNDAELYLLGSDLYVWGSEACESTEHFHLESNFAPSSGCSEHLITVQDQGIASVAHALSLSSPCLLRIDPPEDDEGTPDAVWHVGLNRTFLEPRTGTGLTSATFCLR